MGYLPIRQVTYKKNDHGYDIQDICQRDRQQSKEYQKVYIDQKIGEYANLGRSEIIWDLIFKMVCL